MFQHLYIHKHMHLLYDCLLNIIIFRLLFRYFRSKPNFMWLGLYHEWNTCIRHTTSRKTHLQNDHCGHLQRNSCWNSSLHTSFHQHVRCAAQNVKKFAENTHFIAQYLHRVTVPRSYIRGRSDPSSCASRCSTAPSPCRWSWPAQRPSNSWPLFSSSRGGRTGVLLVVNSSCFRARP